jgi:hypothetical protein
VFIKVRSLIKIKMGRGVGLRENYGYGGNEGSA